MTQRFAGFRLVFAVVALALWAGDAANAQVERTPTAENVVRNVKRTPSLDANPVVAPRRVSEEPVAASRTPDGVARGGGTGGDSARSVGNGRKNQEPENLVPNNGGCGGVSAIPANDLACCLKTCREDLYVCVMGDHGSCPIALSASKTPIQCFKEFKCCLETHCFPVCEPDCEPPCEDVGDGDMCTDTEECCPDLECCWEGNVKKCRDMCVCVPQASRCDKTEDCCDMAECCEGICGIDCCLGLNENGCDDTSLCCDGLQCCDGQCTDDQCCEVDHQPGTPCPACCDGLCCEAGSDTCYSRDVVNNATGVAGHCCFSDEVSEFCFEGVPTVSAKWGWTNGPYTLTEIQAGIDLYVYCGAAKCDVSKAFKNGKIHIETDGTTITMTWSEEVEPTPIIPVQLDPPIGLWQVHLGCGNFPFAEKKLPNDSVSPGIYEFKRTPTDNVIEIDEYSNCNSGLYIIVHFNNAEP